MEVMVSAVHALLMTVLHERRRMVENRRRLLLLLFASPNTTTRRHQRCARQRRFWTRPGRTSSWWDNFENEVVLEEEWRENFRMSRPALLSLSEMLRPHIQGQTTVMRSPVGVVKKVACTLYYLADEGRLRKTANAFGLSTQVTRQIIRQVSRAITIHVDPQYIRLPRTVSQVHEPSSNSMDDFVVPEATETSETTEQEIEDSSDSPEPGPSNLVVRQRRDILQARLQGHRQDRLKRKLPADTQLQHAIEEDVKAKKRIIDLIEASELQSNENMKRMANTLETLTRSVVEGVMMMRQSNMQHAPQVFNMAPQHEHHSGHTHYGSCYGPSPHNSSATPGQGTSPHNFSATPGTYLHTLTPAIPGTYPHNSSFNNSGMDTPLGNGTDSE